MEKLRFPKKPLLQRLKLIIKPRSAQMKSFSTKLIFFILIFLIDINLVLSKEYASEIFFKIRTETNSEAKSIGSYSKGCLAGAEYLPNHSLHYEALKPSRNRFWGHPNLISYIKNTSKEVFETHGNGLILGDLAMPRGGPMPYGHKSHQTGLDVDIFYERKPDLAMSRFELETFKPRSVLSPNQKEINEDLWSDYHYDLLKIATKDDRVTRVFVNPLIKKELCMIAEEKDDMDWLKKIRPWAGHYNHFHVRLGCPKNSELCINQADVNNSTGCGSELDFWMKKDKLFESNSTKIRKWMLLSDLPKSCKKISME